MTRRVKAMFDQIDTMLAQQDQDAADLWHLLTALRGPDIDDKNLKSHTTTQLRGGLFPQSAEVLCPVGHGVGNRFYPARWWGRFFPSMTGTPIVDHVESEADQYDHFIHHFNMAVTAFHRQDLPVPVPEIGVPDGPA